MSALDFAARGLARHALDRATRNGLCPSDFGAAGDGATPDDTAFGLLMDALAGASCGIMRLEGRTYAMQDGGGLIWNRSNSAIIGQGMGQSILRQTNHGTTNGSALMLNSCENVLLEDLTIHGANGYGALYVPTGQTIANVVFHRVRFTADPQSGIDGAWFSSTNGLRWVVDTGSVENVWFIDCLFERCGRMGAEFQNHGAGTTVRYRNIHFIRPRFVDIGGANQNAGFSAGMGISLSGYGDGVTIDRPWFDNVRQICVEQVGVSRCKIRDMLVRHDTLGAALIQATNTKPMHGNEIDGLRWCGTNGAGIVGETPAVATSIRLDNWHDGAVRNVHLNRAGGVALELGVSSPSNGNLIEANSFRSSHTAVISNFQSARNCYRANRIESTGTGTITGLIGIFGDSSTECVVDGNQFVADGSASWSPIGLSGLATARFTRNNHLKGRKLAAQGTMTLASGGSYVAVNHGLPGSPARYGVVARAALGTRTFFSGANATIINVTTNSAVTASTDFHWWAEYDYGNL